MAATTRTWTRADLDLLPDDGIRYELLDGELFVTPLPSLAHQRVVSTLAHRLAAYLEIHEIGFIVGPGAVRRGSSELQPDLLVVLDPTLPMQASWDVAAPLGLAVEVLSPATRRRDLLLKREAYLRWQVPEYWIVDLDERTVTVVRADRTDERVLDTLSWLPRPELPPLVIPLHGVFGDLDSKSDSL